MKSLEIGIISNIYYNGYSDDKNNMDYNLEKDREYIKCRCCGSKSVTRSDNLNVINAELEPYDSTLYVCLVCGDSWIKQTSEVDDLTQIKFSYQVTMKGKLERVGITDNESFHHGSGNIKVWEYRYNDDIIDKNDWKVLLERRRNLLKSLVMN